MIAVVAPGSLTTIQDLGRPGWAHLGVPPSGAADPRSLRLANRLVGNDEGAPALETTIKGPVLRFERSAVVALAGAPVEARAGGRPVAMHAVEHLRPGDVLDVGVARTGARTYLAVRGGIDAELVLGSAASDVLSGLGPAPLVEGTRLAIGARATGWPATEVAPVPPPPERPVLRVLPGPREDAFAPGALAALCGAAWEVTGRSNRVGVRLRGPSLAPADERELPSEGLVTGALEIPPSGEPILLLPDRPTTGGYPVLAVVVTPDLPLAGQLRPGDRVSFRTA